MRKVVLVVGGTSVALLVLVGLAIAHLVPKLYEYDPLPGYGAVSAEEAERVGRRVARALTEGDGEAFDRELDLDALAAQVVHELKALPHLRRSYAAGMKKGLSSQKPSMGTSLAQLLRSTGSSVAFLRVHTVEGRQRAVLRVKPHTGINYLEFLVARAPDGTPKVINWYSHSTGELAHRAMAQVGTARKKPTFSVLLERLFAPERFRKQRTTAEVQRLLKEIRDRLAAGEHDAALAAWERLPEDYKYSRNSLALRLGCSKDPDSPEYRKSVELVQKHFPDDPSLSLVLLDYHFFRKDWAAAMACLDRVSRAVGGDPYLEATRAILLLESGKPDEALQTIRAALAQEPDVPDVHWSAVTISLRRRDFAETARLLDEVAEFFELEIGDLTGVEDYREFVASDAYRAWLARRTSAAVAQ